MLHGSQKKFISSDNFHLRTERLDKGMDIGNGRAISKEVHADKARQGPGSSISRRTASSVSSLLSAT